MSCGRCGSRLRFATEHRQCTPRWNRRSSLLGSLPPASHGIRQGCPMTRSVFALALFPLIRSRSWQTTLQFAGFFRLCGRSCPRRRRSVRAAPHYHGSARPMEAGVGFGLTHIEMCVAIPLWSGPLAEAACWLEADGGLPGLLIFRFVEYLGIQVGPRPRISGWVWRRTSATKPGMWRQPAHVFPRAWHCSTYILRV